MNIFDEVRNNVTISQAIDYLGLKATETKGNQLRFPCPKCGGSDARSLSVNLQKGFRCFKGDKKGDDATALVAHCLGIRNGEAAQRLKDQFLRSATKPEAKADGEGRSGAQVIEARPLELLGIDGELAERLQIEEEGSHVFFPMRDQAGVKLGTIAIATRADLPLVSWIAEAESAEKPVQASSLKDLWRMVKGAA